MRIWKAFYCHLILLLNEIFCVKMPSKAKWPHNIWMGRAIKLIIFFFCSFCFYYFFFVFVCFLFLFLFPPVQNHRQSDEHIFDFCRRQLNRFFILNRILLFRFPSFFCVAQKVKIKSISNERLWNENND